MSASQPAATAATKKVFGLGIDEKIQWVLADVPGPRATHTDRMTWGTFDIDFAGATHPRINLEDQLRTSLTNLKLTQPELFIGVSAIGVSTIGVVSSGSLRSLFRKNLVRRKDGPLVNFKALFRDLFDEEAVESLVVFNDASAKALAEHNLAQEVDPSNAESTLFVTINEGVNGGIIHGSKVLSSSLHPEMGHIRPKLHELDIKFSLAQGQRSCPAHGDCYEAIASAARIRHSWGGVNPPVDFNISDLPVRHDAWDIISYYVAQFCMVGTLTLAPKRLILGGSVVTGRDGDKVSHEKVLKRLWPLIKKQFSALNHGYVFYEEMMADDFIRPARLTKNMNVVAALQAARLAPFRMR